MFVNPVTAAVQAIFKFWFDFDAFSYYEYVILFMKHVDLKLKHRTWGLGICRNLVKLSIDITTLISLCIQFWLEQNIILKILATAFLPVYNWRVDVHSENCWECWELTWCLHKIHVCTYLLEVYMRLLCQLWSNCPAGTNACSLDFWLLALGRKFHTTVDHDVRAELLHPCNEVQKMMVAMKKMTIWVIQA